MEIINNYYILNVNFLLLYKHFHFMSQLFLNHLKKMDNQNLLVLLYFIKYNYLLNPLLIQLYHYYIY